MRPMGPGLGREPDGWNRLLIVSRLVYVGQGRIRVKASRPGTASSERNAEECQDPVHAGSDAASETNPSTGPLNRFGQEAHSVLLTVGQLDLKHTPYRGIWMLRTVSEGGFKVSRADARG